MMSYLASFRKKTQWNVMDNFELHRIAHKLSLKTRAILLLVPNLYYN